MKSILKMNKILYRCLCAAAAIALLPVACAKYVTEDNLTAQKRIREAWMRVNLGEVLSADENGLYILDRTNGSGSVGDTAFVMLDYVVRDLDGNYTNYTTEEAARIMGSYSDAKYYSPEIVQMGKYKLYTPVEKLVKSLGKGGSVKFLLPPEATVYDYPKDLRKYYKNYGNDGTKPALTENSLYEMTVVDVIDDIHQYQIDRLEEYADKNYAGVDSIVKGFYMVKLTENPVETDSIPSGTSVNVNYIGKLLDGYCFDTNIADSAKVYGLYNISKTYSPLSVTYQPNGYTIGENGAKSYASGVVNGFAMTVGRMRYGERAIAFFWSNLAYGSSSSSNYPAYAPMCFYIEIPPKE